MARMLAESRRGRVRARFGASALLLILLAAISACRRGGLSAPGAPVVLISVDTLRADHLPAYGYKSVETPNLDALRRDSVLFANAYARVRQPPRPSLPSPPAPPPPQNGVRDTRGSARGRGPATIASTLKAAGYETGGAVSSVVLSHATGVSRGFDFWEDNVEPTRVNQ